MTRTITVRRWVRLRMGRRKAVGLGAIVVLLAAIVAGGAIWRATWIGRRLLHDWVVKAIASGSGGVYVLRIGHVHFDWSFPPGIAVDSFALATRRALNGARPHPLPGLSIALYRCTIRGVHFFPLVLNSGLVADRFGCESGTLMVQMPHRAAPAPLNPAQAKLALEQPQTFLVLQQSVRLPSYAPRIRIAEVVFPRLVLDVRLPRTSIGAIGLELGQLEWSMAEVVIDPADSAATSRPLFSRSIVLAASNFVTHPDRATAVRVGSLRTSLTDSTLEIHDIAFEPSQSGTAFRRGRRGRHDTITLKVASLTAQGINFGALVNGHGVRARRVDVDSFRIAVTSDKRVPDTSPDSRHRTPQQWIADLDETVSVDSLHVQNGEVVYREHAAGRTQLGVVSFNDIDVSATNVSHFVGRRSSTDPMTITARARLQNAGRFNLRFLVPLDAPRFDMTFRGTLGVMPAMEFNQFVRETDAMMIMNGQVASIVFAATVRNGVAAGTITPRFNDLAVRVTMHGSTGILGNGGIIGGAARGIVSFAANKLGVRSNNPDNPGNAPRVGAISATYRSKDTLIAFLWACVRDGLLSVIKK